MSKRKPNPNPDAIIQLHGNKAATSSPHLNTTLFVEKRKKRPKRQKTRDPQNTAGSDNHINEHASTSTVVGTQLESENPVEEGLDDEKKVQEVAKVEEEEEKACASSGGGEEVQVEEGVEGNQITEQEEVEGVKNEEVEGPKAPPPIGLTNFTFDIQFHPTIDLIACSDVSGRISLYHYDAEESTRIFKKRIHKESCRTICFSDDGKYLYSGSTDRSLKAIDIPSGTVAYTVPDAHKESINALAAQGNYVCTGDDAGVVKFWDIRQATCVFEFRELTEFVSDIQITAKGKVLTTSADGQLSIFSIANKRLQYKVDQLDDELLCLADTGKYIVMGTQSGVLGSVKWGYYEELARMDNNSHSQSVDSIIAHDATTVITGSSDGIIRVVKVVPSKVLHVVGNHDGFLVEQLSFSHDKSILASVGHDNFIKFWDINAVLKGPTVQQLEAAVLEPDVATATTNIFTNIFNSSKSISTIDGSPASTTSNYNNINYTLNNTLATTVPTPEVADEAIDPKKKKPMKKGKVQKLVKAKFYSDL